jgi:hypothetical protein
MINQSPLLREQYESDEKYQEALEFATNFVMSAFRSKRNKLLTDSDWTQANDSPLSNEKKAEWSQYRQALRDITATSLNFATGFVIDDNFFPSKPE